MRFPLAAALLLSFPLLLAVVPATSHTHCFGDDELVRPAHAELAGKSYYLNATTMTALYLYGDANLFVLSPPDTDPCIPLACGPSTDACTVPAGSWLVHVYSTGGVGEFVLLSIDCLAPQIPGCRPPA